MSDRVLLCVDDEASVLRALKRCLRKEAYRVVTATEAREGLRMLETHRVQVVVTDQRMPGMQGITFLQKVKKQYPDTVRVVLSGYADVHMILDSINQGEIYRFLPKPWNDEELKTTLRQCFQQHDLIRQNRELMVQTREQNEKLKGLNGILERMVEERTHSLQLAQEIVEKLPLAVLGISPEGFAALANEAARRLFSHTAFMLGADIDLFLPPALLDPVQRGLQGEASGLDDDRVWLNGSSIGYQLIPLSKGGSARGCILLMERI